MPICPVCEHPQGPGDECEVCGRPLAVRAEAAAPVVRLEELEPTRSAPAQAGEAAALSDLEPTGFSATAAVPLSEDVSGWVERTASSWAADVAVEALEVERTAPSGDRAPPRPAPDAFTCRYCRTVAAPGEVFCARCGVKLLTRWAAEPAAGVERRCRLCGCVGQGAACPACGARFPGEGD